MAVEWNPKTMNSLARAWTIPWEREKMEELSFRAASVGIPCHCSFEDVFQKHSWGSLRRESQNWVVQLTPFIGCVTVLGGQLWETQDIPARYLFRTFLHETSASLGTNQHVKPWRVSGSWDPSASLLLGGVGWALCCPGGAAHLPCCCGCGAQLGAVICCPLDLLGSNPSL